MPRVDFKTCPVCGAQVPYSEWRTLRSGTCRECKRARDRVYSKKYYYDHKDACIERSKQWQAEHPDKIKEYNDNRVARDKAEHISTEEERVDKRNGIFGRLFG